MNVDDTSGVGEKLFDEHGLIDYIDRIGKDITGQAITDGDAGSAYGAAKCNKRLPPPQAHRAQFA